MDDQDLKALITKPEFPRSNAYDPAWILANQMGPNALWLVEWLTSAMKLEPGMRVLDLGCGKAMTSIFLAKEFGVKVLAADLWIGPDHNWERAVAAGVGDLVCPVRAEAHALPFAHGFFDAVVSIDAYQYFGTDQLYLGYLSSYVREGGEIGVGLVGLTRPIDGRPPACLTEPQSNGKVFWENECWSFETADAWRRRWERSGTMTVRLAETMADGWRHWRDFERAVEISGTGVFPSDAEALERDAGSTIGLVRLLATRTAADANDLYDPTIGVRVGVDE